MARFIKLISLGRRGAGTYWLKSKRFQIIASMVLNPSTGLHEAEMPEAEFLKYSKEIAELATTPGLGVYVGGIREEQDDIKLAPEHVEYMAGYNLGREGKPLPDEASNFARAGYVKAQSEVERRDPEPFREPVAEVADNSNGSAPALQDEATGEPIETNLEDQGYNELKEIARGRGVFRVGMSKEVLIEAIRTAQKQQTETPAAV